MDVTSARTDRLISMALAALSARQRVVSSNVANVTTPGFKASRVRFEDTLQSALSEARAKGLAAPATGASSQPPAYRVVTESESSRTPDGNNVDIDREMVELAQTNITYNALAQLAGARMRMLRGVITDGRR